MFGKFKDKLKGWFKGSAEKIEEEAESVEKEEVQEEEIKKAEKIIEKAKSEGVPPVPTKFDSYNRKTIPDLEKVKEEADQMKVEIEAAKKKHKDIKDFEAELERADKVIEEAKKEEIKEVPVKFDVAKEKFEPDLEKIEEEIEEEKEIETKEELQEKKGLFGKLKSSLAYKITEDEFNEIFDDLELLLLENNVALEATESIKENLQENLVGKEIKKQDLESEIKKELKSAISEVLIEPDNPLDFIKLADKPYKILFFGINGTGKTTTIAKVTNFLKKAGFSVALAAGDTFRAASIEQIGEHAKNLDVPLIKQDYGADPAAVGYDAIKYAEKNKIDVVLIDTAGRMHTKSNLLAEMEKIVRVTDPDLKLFVAESVAGNDAVDQAKAFHDTVDIDGSVLSKADIDEKGGTVISVAHATGKPVFYLGTGQNYDDLELFNKQKFIESLGL